MARDGLIEFRRVALDGMKSHAPITALVPAASIYPPRVIANPTWPFIRWGAGGIATPLKAACLNGAIVPATVHAFAHGGDETAGAIGATIYDYFDGPDGLGLSLDLGDGRRANCIAVSATVIPEGTETNDWHAIVNIRATITG